VIDVSLTTDDAGRALMTRQLRSERDGRYKRERVRK